MSDSKNLAMAVSMKRRNKKKMAKGGPVSAKTEQRPMPDQTANDSRMVSAPIEKAPSQDTMTSRPDIRQSTKGPRTTAIKHPKMVPSSVFSTRLRDEEDHLQMLAEGGDVKSSEIDVVRNREKLRRISDKSPKGVHESTDSGNFKGEGTSHAGQLTRGAHRDADKPVFRDHNSMKLNTAKNIHKEKLEELRSMPKPKLAEGGMINEEVSMRDAENDDVVHPEGLESDNDTMGDEDAMNDHMTMLADGGEVEDEHEASLAAACMAKRQYADGGEVNGMDSIETHEDADQVDVSRNAEEDANMEDQTSFNALRKENYSESEGLSRLDSPKDSNEHGHEIDSDEHDMITAIRNKMNKRRNFGV